MKPGIYENIPNETYHRGKGWADNLGSSGVKTLIEKTPAHYLFDKTNPNEPSQAMIFGSAFHSLVLEPDLNEVLWTSIGSRRTNAFKEVKKKNPEKIVVTQEEHEDLLIMLENTKNHELATSLLTNGKPEVSMVWEDMEYGFPCKCRPDWLRDDNIIIDVKTTGKSADAVQFSKACANFGYHISAAWYQAGVLAVTGQLCDFVFLVVETKAPFGVVVYAPDTEFMDRGREAIRPILPIYNECLKTNNWPGYSEKIETLSLPGWA